MWIYVPATDNKEPWVGKISSDESVRYPWTFEVIRHVDMQGMYDPSHFETAPLVLGLLDHQRRCTIIKPLVTNIDRGRYDITSPFQRIRITGQFQALLTGLAVNDADEQIFTNIAFESDSFGAWYAPPVFQTVFNGATKTPNLSIEEPKTNTFIIPDIGNVTCTSRVSLSSGDRSKTIKSTSVFHISFITPVSLNTAMSLCFALERLFGFLIGFRGRFPSFYVQTNQSYNVDGNVFFHNGTLELSGNDFMDSDTPHPMRCAHLNGIGSSPLNHILTTFLSDQDDILSRIHAIEFSRFFSKNLNDRFSVIMPSLEKNLIRRYRTKVTVHSPGTRPRRIDSPIGSSGLASWQTPGFAIQLMDEVQAADRAFAHEPRRL